MSNNHCVLYRTKLKFDGRVSSILNTLAVAFPGDKIIIYELPLDNENHTNFPRNVFFVKPLLYFKYLKKSHFSSILLDIEYAIKAFFFLLKLRPKSIQVHHEIVILPALIYKYLFPKVFLIYDDKEFYHPKDRNIPLLLYKIEHMLISLCDLIIVTNKYRKRALKITHNFDLNSIILVDNYVFDSQKNKINPETKAVLNQIRNNNKKIIVHSGEITESRGKELLKSVIFSLPDNWVMCLIGLNDLNYKDFASTIGFEYRNKIYNLGFINYDELSTFYDDIDACVLFYGSDTFNNKYCAPNRLYSAVNRGVPIIVNKDNITLSDFVSRHNNGLILDSETDSVVFFDFFEKFNQNAESLKNHFEYGMIIPQLKDYYINL
jgi:hypothetical protein